MREYFAKPDWTIALTFLSPLSSICEMGMAEVEGPADMMS